MGVTSGVPTRFSAVLCITENAHLANSAIVVYRIKPVSYWTKGPKGEGICIVGDDPVLALNGLLGTVLC
ncbi:hypothetical protein Dimus_018226 [Dionaea muscipula]